MKYGQLVETGLRFAKSTNKVVIKKSKKLSKSFSVSVFYVNKERSLST